MGENSKVTKSTRTRGWEARAAGWALRHPVMTSIPAGLATLGVQAYENPVRTGVAAAAAAVVTGGWYRGHPESWDAWVAPRLRAFRRRWLSRAYLGPWWRSITEEAGLVTVHRSTGEVKHPRVIRVLSHSPSTESVTVRLLIGQTPKQWRDAAETLAVGLNAERVGIERIGPQKIVLVVQRDEPFTQVIVPPEIPGDTDAIDLREVYLGETEFGTDWTEALIGQHVLVSGASGSGKNSVTWNFVRALAPYIRDGAARLWVGNPKETEMAVAEPVAHRYAVDLGDISSMIGEFWSEMEKRKQVLAEQGLRTFTPSRQTPLDVLLLDELGAVTGYSDSRREVKSTLPLILSQARSLGGSVLAALQEPGKDVLPQRDLFTMRVQMRAVSSLHPDMVLGEDMRARGALADEIPNVPESAGIGYVVRQRSRTPVRVRAAYCNDDDIAEAVDIAGWPMSQLDTTRPAAKLEVEEDTDA